MLGAEDVAGPFEPIPEDTMEKAKLKKLVYSSPLEALSEKFHASPALLTELNRGARFAAGEEIRVPNVIGVVDPAPVANASVVVSKSTSTLAVTDAAGKTIFHAPVTTGSEHDPLPIGDWTVTAIVRNPVFHYNPDLFWEPAGRHRSWRPNSPWAWWD